MTMKKEYVNPKTTVVLLQERHHMLQASQRKNMNMQMDMSGYQQGGTTPSSGSGKDEGDGWGDI
jgi:hypothetical protein